MHPLGILSPGTVVGGDFEVVARLAQGGMGAVYVARQISTGRQRALKVMHPQLVADARSHARFIEEARVGGRIRSEHVVEVIAAGVDKNGPLPWLAMELLEGETLEARVRRVGPLGWAEIARIAAQLAHALGAAHRAGIIHRDLKPANVFLARPQRHGAEDVVKVLDFGIATFLDESMTAVTATTALGSPLWLAPEQTEPGAKLRPSTDVWALGLLVYFAATARSYWRAANAERVSINALVAEVLSRPIESASARAAEQGLADALPEWFDAWFARCVVRDASARFVDATECLKALVVGVAEGASGAGARASRRARVPPAPPRKASGASTVGEAPDVRAFPRLPTDEQAVRPRRRKRPPVAPADSAHVSEDRRVPPTIRMDAAPVASRDATATDAPVPDAPPADADDRADWKWVLGAAGVVAIILLPALFDVGGGGPPEVVVAEVAPEVGPTIPGLSCADGMVPIPGGTFSMGSPEGQGEWADHPLHRVTVGAFCLDRTEVTVRAYGECAEAGVCTAAHRVPLRSVSEFHRSQCNVGRPTHPVNCVGWEQARAYCAWRNGRLPTEAEWEFAARGTEGRIYPWGDAPLDEPEHLPPDPDDVWAPSDPSGRHAQDRTPNGLLDMGGNLAEWVADWYAPYTAEPQTDPRGPRNGLSRVHRGHGGPTRSAAWARAADRGRRRPEEHDVNVGFRCAMTLQVR